MLLLMQMIVLLNGGMSLFIKKYMEKSYVKIGFAENGRCNKSKGGKHRKTDETKCKISVKEQLDIFLNEYNIAFGHTRLIFQTCKQ